MLKQNIRYAIHKICNKLHLFVTATADNDNDHLDSPVNLIEQLLDH